MDTTASFEAGFAFGRRQVEQGHTRDSAYVSAGYGAACDPNNDPKVLAKRDGWRRAWEMAAEDALAAAERTHNAAVANAQPFAA